MNIELLKVLEDAKQIERDLSSRLAEKFTRKKEQSLLSAAQDFERFFKEKGFKVETKPAGIIASYGNLKAELKYEDSPSGYLGCYYRFDLELNLPDKASYYIILNPAKSSSGYNSSGSVSFLQSNEAEKIRAEISRVNESIEQKKSHLENYANEQWHFFLKQGKASTLDSFASMYQLLQSLVE